MSGFVHSNINQELTFKSIKTAPCPMYYLENNTHFNLLLPRTCDFSLKCQRSLLDNPPCYYELDRIISTWNESVNDQGVKATRASLFDKVVNNYRLDLSIERSNIIISSISNHFTLLSSLRPCGSRL